MLHCNINNVTIEHGTLDRPGPVANLLNKEKLCLQQTQSSTPIKPVKKLS